MRSYEDFPTPGAGAVPSSGTLRRQNEIANRTPATREAAPCTTAKMLSGVERKAPVCRHWARHGACRHGDACRFVHGGTISSASVDEGRGGDGAADDDRKSREIEARVAILRAELRALRRSHAESCRQSHVETQSPASGADDAAAGATAPVGTS